MDFPIIISWMNPFLFLRASGVKFHFSKKLVHLKFSEPINVVYNEVFLVICDVHEF